MKQICREISQGNNLEINLPQFFNRLVSLYEKYAEIRFTLHYYTFYEGYLDMNPNQTTEVEQQLLTEVNQIIQNSILSNFSGESMEKNIEKLDEVRNHIIKQMRILTANTDILQNYEYILNRIEYRFRDDLTEINNDEVAAEIVRYIFNSKDNVIINDRIKEVIGQLPIRITKSRYFELIRDSISIYKGADCSSLDSYVYMLKNGAMIYAPEGMDTTYPELLTLRKELESLDYKNMEKEEYLTFSLKIEKAASMINASVDFYYGLQEIVNHLYIMILAAPYAHMEGGYRLESIEGEMKYLLLPPEQEKDLSKSIITEINDHFLSNDKMSIADKIDEQLSYTEGMQESLSEEFEALEPILFDIKSSHINMVESLMLGRIFHCLNTAQNLMGSSLFIDLNQELNNNKADEIYIAKVQEDLINQLSELFVNSSKNVHRAVIANTINKMPVFFQSTNEVMDYVKNSLEQCHDLEEKNACVDIIKTFLNN